MLQTGGHYFLAIRARETHEHTRVKYIFPDVPTVLRRAPRDAPCVVDDLDCLALSLARPTQDFRSTVVDVNEIYGLILGFTSKYKVTGPWKVRITIDQGGFQLGIYQHKWPQFVSREHTTGSGWQSISDELLGYT